MPNNYIQYQSLQQRQERRSRWQYGLSEAQARTIAALYYAGRR